VKGRGGGGKDSQAKKLTGNRQPESALKRLGFIRGVGEDNAT